MIKEKIPYITCACGKQFQVLTAEGTDWDEEATRTEYYEHLWSCAAVNGILPMSNATNNTNNPISSPPGDGNIFTRWWDRIRGR